MRYGRGRCLLDYPIMTFPQLVDRLWREFGPRGALLDELQERLAAGEAIRLADGILNGGSASASRVLGLIRQFKSAGLTAGDLRVALRALPGGADGSAASGAVRAGVAGSADVFERYERLLAERELCDRHDRERAVLEQLLFRAGRRAQLHGQGARVLRLQGS